MTDYYCKCGMHQQSSASGATTALKDPERFYPNQLHEYGEDADLSCKGCPYICSRNGNSEARMSKTEPLLCTQAVKWHHGDNTVCKVHTLDLDFAKQFTDAEKEIDGIVDDMYWDNPNFQISQYAADGRFTLTVNPEPGKRGIEAKQKLYDMFFDSDGFRKDIDPDDEIEKVLHDLVNARKDAQGKDDRMSYKSDDVYISPEGTEVRIHYAEQIGYHSEFRGKGESAWHPLNSSWYPHFPDVCAEFEVYVRRMNLKLEEPECMQEGCAESEVERPDAASTESQPAAEAPDASPADVESAMSIRPDAEAASLAPVFDYSGLDAQTVATLHSAETMIKNARKDYVLKVADAVGMAHDELVALCDKQNNQHSENTFLSWCASQGISKDYAYRLLQVSNLMEASTPNEQKILETMPVTLLYAAAKPSAPAELVAQVKSGDITTNKQFQEAIAAKKAAEEAQRAAEAERDKIAKEKAEQAKQLEASRGLVKMLKEHQGSLRETELDRDAWKQRAEEAENRPTEVAVDETASEKRAQELAEQYRKEDQAVIDQLKSELEKQANPPLSDEDSTELFNVGLQFCATVRNAWKLARKSCMALGGQDRYQICENINNVMKEIKGDMSKCQ